MKRMGARVIAMTALAAQAACMTGPRLVRERPGDYLEMNVPKRVWATLADGQHVVIDAPRVIQDTVFGWSEGEEFVEPTDDLQDLRVQKLSVLRTSVFPTLLAGGLVTAIFVVKQSPGAQAATDNSNLNDCKLDAANHPDECT